MVRAREALLAHGGAGACNVFTRILLALFGILSWRAVPEMPVEIMLLPRWFPIHLDKISYWARTVIVPLLVLRKLRPRARNPRGVAHRRAVPAAARDDHQAGPRRAPEGAVGQRSSSRSTRCCASPSRASRRRCQPARDRQGGGLRRRAAERRGRPRRHLPGHGQQRDDVRRAGLSAETIRAAPSPAPSVEKLLVVKDDEAYCQPCFSPVWDTALAAHALLEAGAPDGRGRGACAASSG